MLLCQTLQTASASLIAAAGGFSPPLIPYENSPPFGYFCTAPLLFPDGTLHMHMDLSTSALLH
jgi:hypothetical protein